MPRKARSRVDVLYNKTITIMQRDVAAIGLLSLGGKLEDAPARHLKDYIKLLRDLKDVEAEASQAMLDKANKAKTALSEKELEKLVK